MHTSITELHYLWPSNCQTLPETHSLFWWTKCLVQMVFRDKDSGCEELLGTQGWAVEGWLYLCGSAKKDFLSLQGMPHKQLSSQTLLTFFPLVSHANKFLFSRVHWFCYFNLPIFFVSFFFSPIKVNAKCYSQEMKSFFFCPQFWHCLPPCHQHCFGAVTLPVPAKHCNASIIGGTCWLHLTIPI